jgi:hypothetical protein
MAAAKLVMMYDGFVGYDRARILMCEEMEVGQGI